MKQIERNISALIKNADVPEEDISIVDFGLRQGFKSVVGIVLALLLGFIMDIPLWSSVFIAIYIPMRRYAGGYHADSEKKCAVLSIISIIVSFSFMKWGWENGIFLFFIGGIGTLILYIFSPVEHPWHRLTRKEKSLFKRISRCLSALLFAVSSVAIIFSYYILAKCVIAVICVCAINLLVGYVKYKQ